MTGHTASHHHGYSWRRITGHKRGGEALSERRPYEFVALLFSLFIVVNASFGSLSGLISYPVLAISAIWLIMKKRWWRVIGFTYPKGSARSLLLFAPIFLPVIWWPFFAPLIGYGTLKIPAGIVVIAAFTLLVGFVEEVYFRGLMLQPLRPKGTWQAMIITSVLFGVAHGMNTIYGASVVYTALQVCYAMGLGFTFAALVLVTRLIWPVILAHALINFSAALNSATDVITPTVRIADYWLTALIIVFYSAYAVFLLRRNPQTSPVNG